MPRKTTTMSEPVSIPAAEPAAAAPSGDVPTEAPVPETESVAAPSGPTLDLAFETLAQALLPFFEDDVPTHTQIQAMRGVYADGNVRVAWTHIITILEQALGEQVTTP